MAAAAAELPGEVLLFRITVKVELTSGTLPSLGGLPTLFVTSTLNSVVGTRIGGQVVAVF